MNINHQNYEQFFFDLVEGNLTPAQEEEVMAFAQADPAMMKELEMFRNSFLDPAEAVVFEAKEALKKGERKGIILPLWKRFSAYAVAASVIIALFLWMNHEPGPGEEVVAEISIPVVNNNKQQKPGTDTIIEEVKTEPEEKKEGVQPIIKTKKYRQPSRLESPAPVFVPAPVPAVEEPNLKVFTYDTTVVNKKDVPEKIIQKAEKPMLASADSVKTTSLSVAVNTDTLRQGATLKERVNGRLENLLGYLTKPKMKIDKVTVDDKTKYILRLENEKLKLVAGL